MIHSTTDATTRSLFSYPSEEYAGMCTRRLGASGKGVAIRLRGESLVVLQEDADRLEAAGTEFAYLHDHEMLDGSHRIVTVPVN